MALIHWVHSKMQEAYSDKVNVPGREALDELIFNLLLQGSSRDRAESAYKALKDDFHDWNELRVSKPSSIERSIKGAGLESVKAVRMVKIMQAIFEDRSEVDLEFLHEMTPSAVRNYLGGMEGVGDNAIDTVLVMSLKQHLFPVTKATLRFAERFGLNQTPGHSFNERIEKDVPQGELAAFVVNLEYHNDEVCRSDKPICPLCILQSNCKTGGKKAGKSTKISTKKENRE